MENKQQTNDVTKFRQNRVKDLKKLYSDDMSTLRANSQSTRYRSGSYQNAAEVRKALEQGSNNVKTLIETSKQLYSINPIYASVINYLADMYMWRYKVTPHKIYSKSKAKLKKQLKEEDFALIYNLMLEVTEGLGVENKFPSILANLFISGSVYYTTYCDEETHAIDTILLGSEYCRKIGESQFGTNIIQFDFEYFDSFGFTKEQIKTYLKSFPKEFLSGYNKYLKDPSNNRWLTLDPRFSSGLMLNEVGVPTYLYLYGGILDYEKYQDNELERNENLLKYIVVHTMPHYEDKLIFEVDEVAAIHQSLRKIVDTGEKARLITTYGDVHVDKISESDTSENEVLSKAFKSIFNNAGFNSGIFTSETVEGLKMSLVRDKAMVWRYVQQLVSFYTIAINNWFDFKEYQADFEILPISPYTYNDDVETYKNNATLGVGKLDYIIASGIKQKNIADQLLLEKFLKLDEIVPMQTSYTQTADDRDANESKESVTNETKKTSTKNSNDNTNSDVNDEIEPSSDDNQVDE